MASPKLLIKLQQTMPPVLAEMYYNDNQSLMIIFSKTKMGASGAKQIKVTGFG